jgi:hypothetical protein
MIRKTCGACLLGLISTSLLASSALADCHAVASSSCADSAACTVLSGSYTNATGKKVKQAEIIATSGDDGKTLASAIVVFTGQVATIYDPNSNTAPSGLNPGGTSTYTISTPFPLAAMDSSLTCTVQTIW